MKLDGLDHVAMAVADVDRSVAWYVAVLGFERMHKGKWGGVPSFVGTGGTGIALFPAENASPDLGILHVAFRASREHFLAAQHELESRGLPFHFEDHGISHSIYFRDPDGHRLELTTYEIDRGDDQSRDGRN